MHTRRESVSSIGLHREFFDKNTTWIIQQGVVGSLIYLIPPNLPSIFPTPSRRCSLEVHGELLSTQLPSALQLQVATLNENRKAFSPPVSWKQKMIVPSTVKTLQQSRFLNLQTPQNWEDFVVAAAVFLNSTNSLAFCSPQKAPSSWWVVLLGLQSDQHPRHVKREFANAFLFSAALFCIAMGNCVQKKTHRAVCIKSTLMLIYELQLSVILFPPFSLPLSVAPIT